jgi:hypothetical protein
MQLAFDRTQSTPCAGFSPWEVEKIDLDPLTSLSSACFLSGVAHPMPLGKKQKLGKAFIAWFL